MLRVFGVVVTIVSWAGCAQPESQPDGPIVRRAIAADVSRPLRDPSVAASSPHHEALAVVANRNFDGLGNGFPGFVVQSAPANPDGDVGPDHYVQVVDASFAVFDKTGQLLYGPRATNVLWSGLGNSCATTNDGEAVVRYDRLADRWVISQFSVSAGPPYLECVAVSASPDPTGAYYRYAFSFGTDWPDYPKIALWPDAYYMTYNVIANGSTFNGARVCAMDRAAMLAGPASPAVTQVCFTTSTTYSGLLVGDLDGPTPPPSGSPAYVLSLGDYSPHLATWKFHVDFATPSASTFTGPTTLTVPAYTPLCGGLSDAPCVPQPATTQLLAGVDDRLMNRVVYRNYGDHEALFATHAVTSGSYHGMRWYEYRDLSGTIPGLFQTGLYAPDSNWRWMGSIAADHVGNIGLGFSVSSSSIKPSIRFTGRQVNDPFGTMPQGEDSLIEGLGSQTGSLAVWGWYSSLNIDPSDDCTFWYTNQYLKANGSFNWSTRIGSFTIPGCLDVTAPTTTITTPVADAKVSGVVDITADASDDVAVTRVDFFAGTTQIGSVTTPPYVVAWDTTTVPNSDVTLTTQAYDAAGNHGTSPGVLVHVDNPPPDTTAPTTTLTAPASFTTITGVTTITATASDDTGVAQVDFLVDGALVGTATAAPYTTSWDSRTVGDGWHSMMSVAYDAAGNNSASPAIVVFVRNTSAAVELVVNGGFESGKLGPWASSGPVALSSTHKSGSWSAQVGSTTATTVDASLSQVVALPSTGTSTLRISYLATCGKKDKHDRQRVYVANGSGTVLATLVDGCVTTKTWKTGSLDLTPYAGTLVYLYATVHDDGVATDPSWMYLDDISVTNQ